MEDFGARPENSLDTCLNELNKSDIYIGIIGMNYGSIYNNEKKKVVTLKKLESHTLRLSMRRLFLMRNLR